MKHILLYSIMILFTCACNKTSSTSVRKTNRVQGEPTYKKDERENEERLKTDANGALGPGTGGLEGAKSVRQEALEHLPDSTK